MIVFQPQRPDSEHHAEDAQPQRQLVGDQLALLRMPPRKPYLLLLAQPPSTTP